jgi:type IV pilus assembly protein PilV
MRTSPVNGFSLIEVLISVFVLTAGIIGAAGMHLTALRTTQQSVFHSNALHFAVELADGMRANIDRMHLPDKDNPYLRVDHQSAASSSSETRPDCHAQSASCNDVELAQSDIDEWLNRIDSTLPGGRVRICRDSAPWNAAAQAFGWDCSAGASGAAPVVIKIGWTDKHHDDTSADGTMSFAPAVAMAVSVQ